LKQAALGDLRTVTRNWEIISPGHTGACPVSLSSVDLKVRLNT
jgi:hypothetical protein